MTSAGAPVPPGSGFADTLRGIRVLDLTRNLAGPHCTMTLADMGADVIKVERPGEGDDTRAWAPPAWNGLSATYLSANRNKRSLAVDITTEAGAAIVLDLAAAADVLVESFRPGSLRRRGLGEEALRARNPDLIHCSISAYGAAGPLREEPGYDPVLQARTGIMSLTGESGGPPVRLGVAALDLGTGLWTALAITTALLRPRGGGRGCHIDASLYETAAWWLSYHVAGYLGSGVEPVRNGSSAGFIMPYEVFPTADEGLFIAAANDALFRSLAAVVGDPGLAEDPRFADNPSRVRNRVALRDRLVVLLAGVGASEWERRLRAAGIACSRIRSVPDLVADPQLEALGMLTPIPHASIPDLRLVDLPISRDGARTRHRLPPPALGEHTDQVLAELGYGAERIAQLREAGVIA